MNLDGKRNRIFRYFIDIDPFGMENIFEQMKKYKGNQKIITKKKRSSSL